MKHLIIILSLLILSISVQAQQTKWDKWRPYIKKAVMITSVVLEAKGDALYDEGLKSKGKLYQAASLATFATLIPLHKKGDNLWAEAASYVAFRIALFDPTYNLSRGLPIDYIGSTSLWDKGLQKFNPPKMAQLWGRAVILGFGITVKF